MDLSMATETIHHVIAGTADQSELLALGFELFIYGGLLYLLYRCLFVSNHPTLIAEEETRAHANRWKTGLFYVPFMGATILIRQEIFRIFILIMVYKALGEYIEIIIPDRTNYLASTASSSSSSSASSSSSNASAASGSSSQSSSASSNDNNAKSKSNKASSINDKASNSSLGASNTASSSSSSSSSASSNASSNAASSASPSSSSSTSTSISTATYSYTLIDRFVQVSGVLLCLSLRVSYEFFGCSICAVFVTLLCVLLLEIMHTGEPLSMRMMNKMTAYWFGIFWIAFPLAHASILVDGVTMNVQGVNYGGVTLLLILATSWIGDAAAYYGTNAAPSLSRSMRLAGLLACLCTRSR